MDHHARWGSLAELHEAFRAFAAPARGAGRCPADERARLARRGVGGEVVALRRRRARARRELGLAVPGAHNRANARAALAAIELAGLDVERGGRGAAPASRACAAGSS